MFEALKSVRLEICSNTQVNFLECFCRYNGRYGRHEAGKGGEAEESAHEEKEKSVSFTVFKSDKANGDNSFCKKTKIIRVRGLHFCILGILWES